MFLQKPEIRNINFQIEVFLFLRITYKTRLRSSESLSVTFFLTKTKRRNKMSW